MDEPIEECKFTKDFEGKEVALTFDKNPEFPGKKSPQSYLSSGKKVLLDKSQIGRPDFEYGIEYLCLIHKEMEKVAFAKIVSKTFEYRVVITVEGLCVVVSQVNNRVERIPQPNIQVATQYLAAKGISKFQVIVHSAHDEAASKGEWVKKP